MECFADLCYAGHACKTAAGIGKSALAIVEVLCKYSADPLAGRKSGGAQMHCTVVGVQSAFPILCVANMARPVRFMYALLAVVCPAAKSIVEDLIQEAANNIDTRILYLNIHRDLAKAMVVRHAANSIRDGCLLNRPL